MNISDYATNNMNNRNNASIIIPPSSNQNNIIMRDNHTKIKESLKLEDFLNYPLKDDDKNKIKSYIKQLKYGNNSKEKEIKKFYEEIMKKVEDYINKRNDLLKKADNIHKEMLKYKESKDYLKIINEEINIFKNGENYDITVYNQSLNKLKDILLHLKK